MTEFLRKLFIKDYQNTGSQRVRERHGILASVSGLVINLLLFSFKLLIGILTFSMSVISEAINNLTDLFSCFVNLFGFKMSAKPADKEHPYGHERIEYIAGMIISFIIIAVAVVLGYTSVQKLLSGESDVEYNIWAFVILGAAILMKLLLGYIYYGIGKAIGSVSLKAGRQDSFFDVATTSVVLISAVIQYFFAQLWWLDAGMSVVVACVILYAGIKTVRETASPLLGAPADGKLVKSVIKDIMSYPGVLGVHDVICHAYGPTRMFMTAHVEVDGHADTFATHEIIDSLEKELGAKYALSLTAHIDPIDTKNGDIPVIKEKISDVLSSVNNGLTMHDLRIVKCAEEIKVIFEVTAPPGAAARDEIKRLVSETLTRHGSGYTAEITFDDDFL